jgi:hypothetical protein
MAEVLVPCVSKYRNAFIFKGQALVWVSDFYKKEITLEDGRLNVASKVGNKQDSVTSLKT